MRIQDASVPPAPQPQPQPQPQPPRPPQPPQSPKPPQTTTNHKPQTTNHEPQPPSPQPPQPPHWRLRSWWRHDTLSVKAAVVSALHHSRDVGLAQHEAPRGQKKTTREEEVNEKYKTPPPGARQGALPQLPAPQKIGAAGLSDKTCCQLWDDSDTPPVLKESDLRFRRNQQRIDTLIIQARRQLHHRNTSRMGTANLARHCCHFPLRIPRVLVSLQTPGPGTRNAERNQWPSCVQPDLTNTRSCELRLH